MRRVRQLITFLIVVLMLLSGMSSVLAQGGELTVSGFAIGRKQVVVAQPRDRARFSGDPDAAREALTRAEGVYERLFGPTRMKVFLEFVARQHPLGDDVYAVGGKETLDVPVPDSARTTNETVCHIIVFNIPGNQLSENLVLTLAHEFAHCYQAFNMPEDPPRLDIQARFWWSEGSAEWLAQKVYNELDRSLDIAKWQNDFIVNLGEGITNGNYSYDAMYFWRALEQQTNVTQTMSFLKQLLRNPDGGAEVLERLPNVNQVFATFGKLMIHGAIRYQPDPARLYKRDNVKLIESLPTTLSLSTDTFSFTPYRLRINVPSAVGIQIKVSGQTANDISVYSPATLEDIPEGGIISTCGLADIPLVVSRGKFKLGGSDSVQLEVTPTDCVPSAPAPACLVGDWRLTSWPGTPDAGTGQILSLGSSGMNISSTGLFTFRLDGIKIQVAAPENRKIQFTLNGVIYTGSIVFAEIEEGKYRPAGGKAALIGTLDAGVQISGVFGIRDVSSSLRRILPRSGTPWGGNTLFVCTSPSTMEYQVTAGGTVVTYKFVK
jgi:hypothetical protein